MKLRFSGIYETRSSFFTSRHIQESINDLSWLNSTDTEDSVEIQYELLKNKVHEWVKNFADDAGVSKVSCFMTEHLCESDLSEKSTMLINESGERISIKLFERHQLDKKQHLNRELMKVDELENEELLSGVKNLKEYTHLVFSPNKQMFNFLVLMRIEQNDVDNINKSCVQFYRALESAVRGVALGSFYKYQSETIQRVTKDLRHELGQSYIGFLANIEFFRDNIQANDYEKRDKIIRNIIKNSFSFAHLTMLRTNITRYMAGIPEPDIQPFYPYGDFLYKWGEIYHENMDRHMLKFILIPLEKDSNGKYIDDPNRPQMFADKDMIEQIAYNLTSNAIKYSIPGSTIILNCTLNDNKDMYNIIITSYGFPMEKESEYKRIFERGFQGSNITGIVKEKNNGNKDSGGIGLAISKEIAEKHNGTLSLHFDKICDYCIPLFDEYCRASNTHNSSELQYFKGLQELYKHPHDIITRMELAENKLRRTNYRYWNDITAVQIKNTNEYTITPTTVVDSIGKGIVRYTFTLSIPHKGSEEINL